MIKVNQITSAAQAARLHKKIDLGGICVSKRVDARSPYLSVTNALALRASLPELPLAVSLDDTFGVRELDALLDDLDAKYFEFTPVDFAKVQQFQAQITELAAVTRPKIANGFFLMQDDCGFIEQTDPFERLREIGVELFQFEIQSAVDDRRPISPTDLTEADALFRRFPTLVSDEIDKISDYPLQSIRGFFFNIAAPGDAVNYDGSLTSFTEARIRRTLIRVTASQF